MERALFGFTEFKNPVPQEMVVPPASEEEREFFNKYLKDFRQ